MNIEISYPYFEKVLQVANEAAISSARRVRSDLRFHWHNGSHLFVATDSKPDSKQGRKPIPQSAGELERAVAEYNEQYPDAYMVGVEIVLNSAVSEEVKALYEKTTEYVENEECEFCTGAADYYLWQRP